MAKHAELYSKLRQTFKERPFDNSWFSPEGIFCVPGAPSQGVMSGVGEGGSEGSEPYASCVAGGYDAFCEDCPLLCVTQQFSFLSSGRPDLLPHTPDVSVVISSRILIFTLGFSLKLIYLCCCCCCFWDGWVGGGATYLQKIPLMICFRFYAHAEQHLFKILHAGRKK